MDSPNVSRDQAERIERATAKLQAEFPELSLLVLAAPAGTQLADLPALLRRTADSLERRVTARRN